MKYEELLCKTVTEKDCGVQAWWGTINTNMKVSENAELQHLRVTRFLE